jgi:hypothetical protein
MAGRFPDAFLDDLRAALPVLDVVGRRHQLRKEGSSFVSISDKSVVVTPGKNVWAEFGKGRGSPNSAGDIFAFEMFDTGCTFQEAVERLAQMAGIPLPKGHAAPRPPPASNGHAGPIDPEPPPHEGDDRHAPASSGSSKPRREITATYDYRDADGALVYQACRQEWTAPDGKRHKTFMQRRPYGPETGRPDQPWIWGLKAGTFVRGNSGSFYREDRNAGWEGAERIEVAEATPHMLYRFPELREEMAQPPNERRTIMIPEGEKDVETLRAWGIVATTNSGGAKNWHPEFADEMRGADVVVLLDNDQAGRDRGHAVALSLRETARSVKALDWGQHWPGCPPGGDVTDWRDKAGGTFDKLFAIVDKLPPWSPPMPTSAFSAVRFSDIDSNAKPLTWAIKGILQRGTVSLWYGAPSCGKSFLLTDAAMAIARNIYWMGHRTRQGLVVYQTGEGGIGFRMRLKAYRVESSMKPEESARVPFVYLPARINLFHEDADVNKLIAEIEGWARFYDQTLELVAIDTFNAASGGANENANQDVGRVLDRCRRIAEVTGAHVAVVHHTPAAGGKPRGHSSLVGDVETTIAVEETEEMETTQLDDGRELRRPIRTWTVVKQKDGPSKIGKAFVLKQVRIGEMTEDNTEEETSCAVVPLETAVAVAEKHAVPEGWVQLIPSNLDIFRALVRALKKSEPPPPDAGVPRGQMACTIGAWNAALVETVMGHETITPTTRAKIKQRIYRAQNAWLGEGARNLIAKHGEWVWRTGRCVYMVDQIPVARAVAPAPKTIMKKGETEDDIPFL